MGGGCWEGRGGGGEEVGVWDREKKEKEKEKNKRGKERGSVKADHVFKKKCKIMFILETSMKDVCSKKG